MVDTVSKKQRSKIMSRVRSKETKAEIILRSALRKMKLKFKMYYDIPGKPDIVFADKKIAIFVDGCFWHKCPYCFRAPKSNKKYWVQKIKSNVLRDKKINSQLKKGGWKVIRLWEHEVNRNIERCVNKIINI